MLGIIMTIIRIITTNKIVHIRINVSNMNLIYGYSMTDFHNNI